MKKCPKCKTLWTDETKFCGKCGTKLEHAETMTEEKKVPAKEKMETKQIVLPEKITTTRNCGGTCSCCIDCRWRRCNSKGFKFKQQSICVSF